MNLFQKKKEKKEEKKRERCLPLLCTALFDQLMQS